MDFRVWCGLFLLDLEMIIVMHVIFTKQLVISILQYDLITVISMLQF